MHDTNVSVRFQCSLVFAVSLEDRLLFRPTDTFLSSILKVIPKLNVYTYLGTTQVWVVGRLAQSLYRLSYGLDGTGSNPRWGRDFPPVQTGPAAHPASCKMSTGSFPEVNCGQGVLPTTHPLLVPRSWKSRAVTLPTLWATPGL